MKFRLIFHNLLDLYSIYMQHNLLHDYYGFLIFKTFGFIMFFSDSLQPETKIDAAGTFSAIYY